MSTESFLKSQLLVAAGYMATNFSNYATSLLAGRSLPDTTFASYIALSSFISILAVSGSLVQPVISVEVSSQTVKDQNRIASLLGVCSSLTILLVTVNFLSYPLFYAALEDVGLTTFVLSCVLIGVFALLPVFVGLAHGLFKFMDFFYAFVIGGVSRPIFFVIFVYPKPTLFRALLATGLSAVLTASVLLARLPNGRSTIASLLRPRLPPFGQRTATPVILMASSSVLAFSDVVIARLNLSGSELRSFAAAALFTNITLYGAMSISSVLTPFAARLRTKSQDPSIVARTSVLIAIAFGAGSSLVLLMVGGRLITLTMGFEPELSNLSLFFYSVIFVGISVIFMNANYELATEKRLWVAIAYASFAIIFVISTSALGTSISRILWIEATVVSGLIAMISLTPHSLLRTSKKYPLQEISSSDKHA